VIFGGFWGILGDFGGFWGILRFARCVHGT